LADRCRRSGLAPSAGQENVCLYDQVCELITHIKKLKGTKTLVKDFGMISDILGDRMGCFLFQLPPSIATPKPASMIQPGRSCPSQRRGIQARQLVE
jgi:uncharacterized protein YecE (DUF72 family)